MRSTIAVLSLSAFLFALTAGGLLAGDKNKGAAKSDSKAKFEAKEKSKEKSKEKAKDKDTTIALQLTGVLAKEEVKKINKEGKECSTTVYFLPVEGGERITLPSSCGLKDKEGEALDMNSFVDKEVDVNARGWIKKGKEGKEKTAVHRIVSIDTRSVR